MNKTEKKHQFEIFGQNFNKQKNTYNLLRLLTPELIK